MNNASDDLEYVSFSNSLFRDEPNKMLNGVTQLRLFRYLQVTFIELKKSQDTPQRGVSRWQAVELNSGHG